MSMFNDIFCDRYDNKDECLKNANSVKTFAGEIWYWGNGHLLDQVLRKNVFFREQSTRSLGPILRKKCCWNSQQTDILSSVQRLHCPGVSRIILSVNQLSVYGAVWQPICEEFEYHQDRTGQLVILVGQSIVLGEVKAAIPVHDEDPRNDQIIWQQIIQQIESLSPENRVSKFL